MRFFIEEANEKEIVQGIAERRTEKMPKQPVFIMKRGRTMPRYINKTEMQIEWPYIMSSLYGYVCRDRKTGMCKRDITKEEHSPQIMMILPDLSRAGVSRVFGIVFHGYLTRYSEENIYSHS